MLLAQYMIMASGCVAAQSSNWWTNDLEFCVGLACCIAREEPSAGSMVLLTQRA